MNSKKCFLLIIFVFFTIYSVHSQDTASEGQRFGIFYNYRVNEHRVNFQALPGIPNCCPRFENGKGTGYSIGLSWELPLPFRLRLGLRGSYSVLDGKLSTLEPTVVKIDDNQVVGTFEHVIDAKISDLSAEPYISFNPVWGLDLFAGWHIGYMTKSTYSQYEKIVDPPDRGVFVDTKTRFRNEVSGTLPQVNSGFGAFFLGASYNLPLNSSKTFLLVPEISYLVGQTDIVQNTEWKISGLQIGLGLKYNYVHKPEVKKIIERKTEVNYFDTVKIVTSAYRTKTVVTGQTETRTKKIIDVDTITTCYLNYRTDTLFMPEKLQIGIRSNSPSIYMQTQYVSQVIPILPDIFFDKDSGELSKFYQTEVKREKFSIDSLDENPVDCHKNLLNIIGFRLRENKSAIITLAGFADSISENSDCKLAKNRAEAVKNYLINIWGIESERITDNTGKTGCSPKEASQTRNETGYSDNRRVEITANEPSVLASVVTKRFKESKNVSPSFIRFEPYGANLGNVASWNLEMHQGAVPIANFRGTGEPQPFQETLTNDKLSLLESGTPLVINLTGIDYEGNAFEAGTKMIIQNDTAEVEIHRLSLILFDVSSTTVPDRAKEDIVSFFSSAPKNASCTVTGYSDILGNEKSNLVLSEKRAQNVANLIKTLFPAIKITDVRGFGSSLFPPGINSYSTPAERFLSRTVTIELK